MMREKVVLRCGVLVFSWYIILQILYIPLRNLVSIRVLSLMIMGLFVLIAKKKNSFRFQYPGHKRKGIIFIAVCLGIGMAFFNIIVSIPLIRSGQLAQMESFSFSIRDFYLNILYGVIGAVIEELFFRGILLNICKPHFKARTAIILTAILFSLAHLPSLAAFHTLLGGIIFGYLYYYTENIMIPIIAHITINLMWSTLLAGVLIEVIAGTTGELIAVLISAAAGLFIIGSMLFFFQKKEVRR